jgi:hypothetical protein
MTCREEDNGEWAVVTVRSRQFSIFHLRFVICHLSFVIWVEVRRVSERWKMTNNDKSQMENGKWKKEKGKRKKENPCNH